MSVLYILDIAGTLAFAMSGAMSAINRKLDTFGVLLIALVTAIGGGTVRDCLLGSTPVSWMQDETYIYTIIGAVIATIIFKKHVYKLKKTLFLFDTIGIGVFTAIGVSKSIEVGVPFTGAVAMGMTSAVVGGVIRDVLCNDIPLILHKEIYATCCIIGATVYVLLEGSISNSLNMAISASIIIIIRLITVYYNLSLPKITSPQK